MEILTRFLFSLLFSYVLSSAIQSLYSDVKGVKYKIQWDLFWIITFINLTIFNIIGYVKIGFDQMHI